MERVDGHDRKQWEFILQIQRKHVAPQIVLHLSINHICAQCCGCGANGITLVSVCFMHLCHSK